MLVKLTQIERNGVEIASELMLIDTTVINRPMVQNSLNKTVLSVQESIMEARQSESNNSVQYIVDEDLATVAGLSTDMFVATVVTRDAREPVPGFSSLGFVASRGVGGIRAEGSGSKFFYHEDGGNLPVEYIVSEDINTIEASL